MGLGDGAGVGWFSGKFPSASIFVFLFPLPPVVGGRVSGPGVGVGDGLAAADGALLFFDMVLLLERVTFCRRAEPDRARTRYHPAKMHAGTKRSQFRDVKMGRFWEGYAEKCAKSRDAAVVGA